MNSKRIAVLRKAEDKDNQVKILLVMRAEKLNRYITTNRFCVIVREHGLNTGEIKANDYNHAVDKFYNLIESACRYNAMQFKTEIVHA